MIFDENQFYFDFNMNLEIKTETQIQFWGLVQSPCLDVSKRKSSSKLTWFLKLTSQCSQSVFAHLIVKRVSVWLCQMIIGFLSWISEFGYFTFKIIFFSIHLALLCILWNWVFVCCLLLLSISFPLTVETFCKKVSLFRFL